MVKQKAENKKKNVIKNGNHTEELINIFRDLSCKKKQDEQTDKNGTKSTNRP